MHPESLYNLAAWGATALNTAISLAVYAYRRGALSLPHGKNRPAATVSRMSAVVSALTVAALCCLAENILALPYAGPFGMIRLAQYNLAVPTAALGLAVAIDSAWNRAAGVRLLDRLLAVALVLPGLTIAHAAFVGPYKLRTERADVEIAAQIPSTDPIRIVVLSDLQTDRVTDHENVAVDIALAERPDLILMPGDLFHVSEPRWRERKERFHALLSRIEAPAGVFAVQGNVDFLNRLRPFLRTTPVRLLENEVVTVEIRGTQVAIAGLELYYVTAAADAAVDRLVDTNADVKILLAHYPDAIEKLQGVDGIDLLVAGHTHGGQVVIPGFGPPMTLSDVPRSVAAGGLHEMYGRQIYVSRGIGMERGAAPPVRFFCPPEVSVLSLR